MQTDKQINIQINVQHNDLALDWNCIFKWVLNELRTNSFIQKKSFMDLMTGQKKHLE